MAKPVLSLGHIAMAAVFCFCGAARAADLPGQTFHIDPGSLPKPHATPAAAGDPEVVPRKASDTLAAPKGFEVSAFATGLADPRWMAVAPNGDVMVAKPRTGQVVVLRDSKGSGRADIRKVFASGFKRPHGLAFHGGSLYVGDVRAVWRLPYKDGALLTGGAPQRITTRADLNASSGHWTRDIAFDSKGTLYVGVGSRDNISEEPLPGASVEMVDASGKLVPFATGLRNPVGLAFYPGTDDLYVTVNERDGLGDGLPPDYLTLVHRGDFFGWPYAYTGPHPDPDYGSKRPDLVGKTKMGDVLFQPHSAPLGLVFYDAQQFPEEYRGNAFVALHGSWNSAHPTGYKVVRVKFEHGRPVGGPGGSYENFVTGFWAGGTSPARVWGRPAGLAVTKDGSLLIADEVSKTIWRVRYTGH